MIKSSNFLNIQKDSTYAIFLALSFAILTLGIFPWYFPLTEGWWETYIWIASNGKSLYKDIYFAFPPLQIFLVKTQIDIFGYNFFWIRAFGALFDVLGVVLTYIWLRKLVSRQASFLGALIAGVLALYGNKAYISGDYHSLVVVLELLSLIGLTNFIVSQNERISSNASNLQFVLISGLSCGALFLTKQNIAVFFTFATLVVIFLEELKFKKTAQLFRLTPFFLLILFAIPFLYSLVYGTSWLSCYFNNHSKGPISVVLFRFILENDLRDLIYTFLMLVFLTDGIRRLRTYIEFSSSAIDKRIILFLFDPLVLFGLFVLFVLLIDISPSNLLFSFCFLWIYKKAFQAWQSPCINNWYRLGWIPLVALAYSGTNTAGYNFVSMQLLIALFISGIIDQTSSLEHFRNKFYVIFLGIAFSTFILIGRLSSNIYDWWGVYQGNFFQAKYSLPFKELEYFKVDKNTAEIFNEIYDYKNILKKEDEIFAYPSIPIIYFLLKKEPLVSAPVMWFDVTDTSLTTDILASLNNNLPKTIFWLKPAHSVYNGHYKLRKISSLMSEIDGWIYGQILRRNYAVDSVHIGYKDDLVSEVFEPVTLDFIVSKESVSWGLIRQLPGIISEQNPMFDDDYIFPLGTRIKLQFKNKYYVQKNASQIGIPDIVDGESVFLILNRRS